MTGPVTPGTPGSRLDDGTVVLVPLRVSDAADHFAGEDAALVRWLNGGPGSLEGVRDHLQRVERDWRGEGEPIYSFAIRDARSDVLMGTLDLQLEQPATRPGQANLAYGLYAPWRGRGIATRAVRLGCTFLAEHTEITGALIRTAADNPASAAVAVRCGFTLVQRAEDADGLDRWERDVLGAQRNSPRRRTS